VATIIKDGIIDNEIAGMMACILKYILRVGYGIYRRLFYENFGRYYFLGFLVCTDR
jgi:hypothetical protein